MRFTVAIAVILWAGGAVASPKGVWQTESTEDGRYLYVKVHPCNQAAGQLCGTIVDAFGDVSEKLIGLSIIWNMTPDGDNRWDHGKILGVKETIYDSEMKLPQLSIVRILCFASGNPPLMVCQNSI